MTGPVARGPLPGIASARLTGGKVTSDPAKPVCGRKVRDRARRVQTGDSGESGASPGTLRAEAPTLRWPARHRPNTKARNDKRGQWPGQSPSGTCATRSARWRASAVESAEQSRLGHADEQRPQFVGCSLVGDHGGAGPGDDHQIEPRWSHLLHASVTLANPAFHSISHHRRPHLLADCHTQASCALRCF